ncbi:MAG: phosphopantetheine-binding protein [Nitrospira sp.]|nr:phosphopantetheine-binding protein [Nitrospira sp.]
MADLAVTQQIIQSLATYLKRDPASITESHHLRDDLGLDSVAVIELLFEIEDRFKIQIPDQDLVGLSTVGSVAAYVQERLASPKAAPKSATKTPAKPVAKPAAKAPAKSSTKPKSKAKAASPPARKPAAKPKTAQAAKGKKR